MGLCAVLLRMMGAARKVLGPAKVEFGNRTRRAKRRCKEIAYAKTTQDRQQAYRDLLAVTEEVYDCGLGVRDLLRRPEILADLDLRAGLKMSTLAGAFDHYLPLRATSHN